MSHNCLKPGFTPAGWKRGDPLLMWPARILTNGDRWRGKVQQDYRNMPLIPISGPHAIRGDDVAYVAFDHGDGPEVDAWLKWWHA